LNFVEFLGITNTKQHCAGPVETYRVTHAVCIVRSWHASCCCHLALCRPKCFSFIDSI